ncbi:YopX family protein [Campylobacter concisus]|uniref:YopX family protein n=1 Tax=Campylobacter concisus TaxID=199 RepID=UPI0011E66562|nr:YopX family protein [Campylobacter concisus]
MREIRFRAWDKQEKKMVYDVEHAYDGYPIDTASSFGEMLDCPDFYDVMQYIGIRDVNSNRIYGKDIVRITTTQTEETRIGEVKYYDDNACYLVETTKEEYFTFMSEYIKSVEVIGNIYENKELLDE